MNRNTEQQDIGNKPGAMIEFEASIMASRLTHAVSVLQGTDDYAIFEIDDNVIISRVVDPGNVAMTQVSISMMNGDHCTSPEPYRVGIDLNNMESILERADAKDYISIEADGNRVWYFMRNIPQRRTTFKRGIHRRSLPLLDPEALRECPPRLKLPHIATVRLSGEEFKEIIAEANDVGVALEFKASADGVIFSTKSTSTPTKTYIGTFPVERVELLPGSIARGLYRLDNLEAFAMNIIPEDEIVVQFANDTPCEIRYERDGVSVQQIMAPRFESR